MGLSQPIRKVYYNMTITGLSVAVAVIIGSIELFGLLGEKLDLTTGPLGAIQQISLDYVGYAIVGIFVITWAIALAVWRFGRIEEKWSTKGWVIPQGRHRNQQRP